MATAIGDLVVKLGATTGDFDRKMGGARKVLGRFSGAVGNVTGRLRALGGGMLGMAGAGGIGYAIKRQIDMMDAAGKLSDRVGITTEKLAGLRYAAELTGAGAGKLDAALVVMAKRLGEAARGAGSAKPALERLGLPIEDLIRLSPDQQFYRIADAIARLPTQSERAAAAANLFSRGNMELINTLALGSEGLARMQREAERMGKTFTREMARKAEEANDSISRLTTSLGSHLIPMAADAADAIVPIADALTEVSNAYRKLESLGPPGKFLKGISTGVGQIRMITDEWRRFRELISTGYNVENVQRLYGLGRLYGGDGVAHHALPRAAEPGAAGAGGAPAPVDEGAAADAAARARAIIEATQTPMERLRGQVNELMRLWVSGALGKDWGVVQRQMNAYADAAREAMKTPVYQQFAQLREEAARLSGALTDSQIALRRFAEMPGVTPEQINQFSRLQEQIRGLKMVQAAEARRKALEAEGKAMTRQFLTPLERAREQIARIQQLERAGVITAETAERALRKEAMTLLPAAREENRPAYIETPALKAGSKEAYHAIMRANAMATGGRGPKEIVPTLKAILKQLGLSDDRLQQIAEKEPVEVNI